MADTLRIYVIRLAVPAPGASQEAWVRCTGVYLVGTDLTDSAGEAASVDQTRLADQLWSAPLLLSVEGDWWSDDPVAGAMRREAPVKEVVTDAPRTDHRYS